MSSHKIIKGKRPEFYDAPGVDYLMQMVMVLSQELSATRDRIDTIERVAKEKGLFSLEDIESYTPDQEVLEYREASRQKFLSNFFSVMTQEAAEIDRGDTKKSFDSAIEEFAKD